MFIPNSELQLTEPDRRAGLLASLAMLRRVRIRALILPVLAVFLLLACGLLALALWRLHGP